MDELDRKVMAMIPNDLACRYQAVWVASKRALDLQLFSIVGGGVAAIFFWVSVFDPKLSWLIVGFSILSIAFPLYLLAGYRFRKSMDALDELRDEILRRQREQN